jgi:hypothetical protein
MDENHAPSGCPASEIYYWYWRKGLLERIAG